MKHLISIIIILITLGIGGCGINPNVSSTALENTSISIADNDVVQAQPHADAPGKTLLSDAHHQLQTALDDVQKTQQQLNTQQDTIKTQQERLAAYKTHWLGDRTIALGKWLIVAITLITVGDVVLSLLPFPWAAPVAAIVGALNPLTGLCGLVCKLFKRS